VGRASDMEEIGSRGVQLDQLIDSLKSERLKTLSLARRYSGPPRKSQLKAALFLSLLMTLSLGTFFGTMLIWGSGCGSNPATAIATSRSIALVDSLAVDSPNPGLVENLSSLAKAAVTPLHNTRPRP